MSYPDPQTTLPPQSFPSPPFSGGDAGGFWPQYVVVDEQPPNGFTQYDPQQPFKRQRSLEQGTSLPSFQPMNPRTNPPPNGAVGKGTSHIFYKTRLCAQFRDGNCRNGDHCNFAHGSGDLRHPPPNWQDLVREKDRGAGTGGLGDDQRNLHRMKICKKYYNGEECPYGDKCNFIHERSSQLKKPEILGTRESSAISIGVTGDARVGSSDFDQTAFWKTKLCLKWEIGMCPYGDRCSYAHGQSELRFSAAVCEAEQATNGFSIPRKSTPVSTFNSAANLVACAPPDGDEGQKALKWKLKKKLNRIYADWIDNLSPPDCSPTREEN